MLVKDNTARRLGAFGQWEMATAPSAEETSTTQSSTSDWVSAVTDIFSKAVVPTVQAIRGAPVTASPVKPTSFGAGAVGKAGVAGMSTGTIIGIGAIGLVAYYMMKGGKRSRA